MPHLFGGFRFEVKHLMTLDLAARLITGGFFFRLGTHSARHAFALPSTNNTALSHNIAAKTSASRTSTGLVNEPGAFRANTTAMPKQKPAKSVLMIPCCAECPLREMDIAQQVDGKLPQRPLTK
jgi:hypothetical protein